MIVSAPDAPVISAVAQNRDAQRVISSSSSNRAASNRQGCHHGVVTASSNNGAASQTAIQRKRVIAFSQRDAVCISSSAEHNCVVRGVCCAAIGGTGNRRAIYLVIEGQQVSTAATHQRGVRNRSSNRETVITLTTMQVSAGDTSSDIDSVISAVRLDIGIRQRVAQLEAVLSLGHHKCSNC